MGRAACCKGCREGAAKEGEEATEDEEPRELKVFLEGGFGSLCHIS